MLRDFINTDKRCLKKTHPIKNTKFKFSIVWKILYEKYVT